MQGNAQTLVDVQIGLESANMEATATGTGIDRTGFNDCLVVLDAGLATGDGSLTVTIEESNTLGSGYTAISGAAFTAVTSANDHAQFKGRVKLHNKKTYIRAVGTYAGTGASNGVNAAVLLILMNPQDTEFIGDTYAFNVTS